VNADSKTVSPTTTAAHRFITVVIFAIVLIILSVVAMLDSRPGDSIIIISSSVATVSAHSPETVQ
jgi:hypothetical protein